MLDTEKERACNIPCSLRKEFNMPPYTVITQKKVWDRVHGMEMIDDELYEEQQEKFYEELYEEQQEKLKELGFIYHDWSHDYKVHFFDSIFRDECTIYETLSNAIELLAVKDGVDLVRFENGNYGFVAYYNNHENGFEILEG